VKFWNPEMMIGLKTLNVLFEIDIAAAVSFETWRLQIRIVSPAFLLSGFWLLALWMKNSFDPDDFHVVTDVRVNTPTKLRCSP
jgi:hypothetical protein